MTVKKWRVLFIGFLSSVICHLSSACHAESREETLKRVEKYLNGITTVTADFNQVAPDGSLSGGKFYMSRPGKMRWEYNPPVPILIIADGIFVNYYDKELEQISQIPIFKTMISFIAEEEIKLGGDEITVEEVEAKKGMVRVTALKKGSEDEGKITLEFSDSPLELRSMITTDATHQKTQIAFSNAKFSQELDKDLFYFQDPRKPRKRS